MEIRLAEYRDIPGMIALLHQVGQVHHDIRPDIFRDGALKYDEAALEQLVKEEDKPIFVAVEQGFVAGYCFCQLRCTTGSSVLTDRAELYIDDLCVDENCRGQGIATALYRYAVDFARDLNAHSVTLNVWCGNESALRFYEKMGMKKRNIMMETKL